MAEATLTKLADLRARLSSMQPVTVAFSGGADSAFLAWVATDTLGPGAATCVTAVSASLAPEELADCRSLAAEWKLSFRTVETAETERHEYVLNSRDRCFHCKTELMETLAPLAQRAGATIVLGVNLDDLDDHRPGQIAASQGGARFPLVESRFTKAEVRSCSRALGLRTWDKPAAACLSSRVPYGTPVTVEVLGRVARAESALRGMGLTQLRVRHYGDVARIEVEPEDLAGIVAARGDVVAAVKGAGYRYVTLDLEGFRSGNLNEGSSDEASHRRPGSFAGPIGVAR